LYEQNIIYTNLLFVCFIVLIFLNVKLLLTWYFERWNGSARSDLLLIFICFMLFSDNIKLPKIFLSWTSMIHECTFFFWFYVHVFIYSSTYNTLYLCIFLFFCFSWIESYLTITNIVFTVVNMYYLRVIVFLREFLFIFVTKIYTYISFSLFLMNCI